MRKDNTITFKTGGTWTEDEGSTKCSNSDPQTDNGTWVLSNSDKTLTITTSNNSGGLDAGAYYVEQLDGSTLKISTSDTDSATKAVTKFTATFSH